MRNIFNTDHQQNEELFLKLLANFKQSELVNLQFSFSYQYPQYYLAEKPSIALCAIFCFSKQLNTIDMHCTVFIEAADTKALLLALPDSPLAVQEFVERHSLPFIKLNGPIGLSPCHIEKPWGKEIWFTGIEQRGHAFFTATQLCSSKSDQPGIPLPWLLDLLPDSLTNNLNKALVLLKILAPLPDKVFGDLYFEMHQVKQEVYVVTHIDKSAWPDEVGQIRYGFNQEKLQHYATDAEFKQDFSSAVKRYYTVRQKIDQLLDQQKLLANYAVNQAIPVPLMQDWLAELPVALINKERSLRTDVESFIGTKSLRVGDVVVIPCLVPHSLMHGVRTIEFQTPVYERSILYFAQKVLTQSGWDTEAALQKIEVNSIPQPKVHNISNSSDLKIDKIVNYPQFEVFRYELAAQSEFELALAGKYGLIIGISGVVEIEQLSIGCEQACFISCFYKIDQIHNVKSRGKIAAVFLLAVPKISLDV